MPKITALRVQTRNKSRVNVYLDGDFAFGLTKLVAIRLRVGQELDDAALERLKAADAVEAAHERALKFLEARPRSEAEVRRRLREHDVPAAAMDEVITRLARSGLLNDAAFANYWVENRQTFRPRSRRALQQELRRKGIQGDALQTALAAADDETAAYQLAQRQVRRFKALAWPDFRRKLGEFLARRGFGFDLVKPTIERVWRELNDPPTHTDWDDNPDTPESE
jgi:regulatory protein